MPSRRQLTVSSGPASRPWDPARRRCRALAGPRRPVDDARRRGWSASRAWASSTFAPMTFGTSTSFGLQSASCCGSKPTKKTNVADVAALSVVAHPAGRRGASRESARVRVRRRGEVLRLLPRAAVESRLREGLPDQRRVRPAGDRLSVELASASAAAGPGSRPRRPPRAGACSRRTRRHRSSRWCRSCRRPGGRRVAPGDPFPAARPPGGSS